MALGPLILPGLALLMLVALIYVTAAWVFDGTRPEEDIAYLDESAPDARDKAEPPHKPRR